MKFLIQWKKNSLPPHFLNCNLYRIPSLSMQNQMTTLSLLANHDMRGSRMNQCQIVSRFWISFTQNLPPSSSIPPTQAAMIYFPLTWARSRSHPSHIASYAVFFKLKFMTSDLFAETLSFSGLMKPYKKHRHGLYSSLQCYNRGSSGGVAVEQSLCPDLYCKSHMTEQLNP